MQSVDVLDMHKAQPVLCTGYKLNIDWLIC